MTSPLTYILQAAMGQCSHLQGNNDNNGFPLDSTSDSHRKNHHRTNGQSSARSSSDNSTTPLRKSERGNTENMNRFLHVNTNMNKKQPSNSNKCNFSKDNYSQQGPTSPRKHNSQFPSGDESREENHVQIPEGSLKARCYRLNLEQSVCITSPTSNENSGPLTYEPPPHHRSKGSNRRRVHSWHATQDAMMTLQVTDSDDNMSNASSHKSATQVAISTARIFRGISVDKNGTILSQNARASRSSRSKGGSAVKQGEKSRQAAKIDKAKDLVDDCIANAGKENEGEKMNLVSLVIMGEYNDMKQLVKDGAKKLRDAEGMPDEALLNLNRPRNLNSLLGPPYPNSQGFGDSPPTSPSRKRLNMHFQQNATPVRSRNRLQIPYDAPGSAPPKLKGHPRDKPSSRRATSSNGDHNESRNSGRFRNNCHDIFPLGREDSDWSGFSKGFNNLWNCGATANNGETMSPTNKNIKADYQTVSTPINTPDMVVDRRHETATRYNNGRGMEGREAPGGVVIV